jgi:DNA polymerase III sliding clamp (beta) subunit (PCNA family)
MIKFKTKELEQALRIVAPAIGNPTLSACDYVHLSIKGDKATLRATNLNLEITTTCSCTGDVEPFLLPHKPIFNAIAVTLEDEVSITTKDDSISLLLGEDTLNLPIERITIFPKMQEIGETKILAIKDDFIAALKVAIKFQEASELRPGINGVLLKFLPDNTCYIAATNAEYIYKKTLPYNEVGEYHLTQAFVDAIKTGDTLMLNEQFVGLKDNDTVITCLLNSRRFVNVDEYYQNEIIPNFSFSLNDLLPKLNIIISQQIKEYSTTTFRLLQTSFKIHFEDKDFDKSYSSKAIKCVNNSDVKEISFQTRALKDILLSCEADNIQMFIDSAERLIYIISDNTNNILSPQVKNAVK